MSRSTRYCVRRPIGTSVSSSSGPRSRMHRVASHPSWPPSRTASGRHGAVVRTVGGVTESRLARTARVCVAAMMVHRLCGARPAAMMVRRPCVARPAAMMVHRLYGGHLAAMMVHRLYGGHLAAMMVRRPCGGHLAGRIGRRLRFVRMRRHPDRSRGRRCSRRSRLARRSGLHSGHVPRSRRSLARCSGPTATSFGVGGMRPAVATM